MCITVSDTAIRAATATRLAVVTETWPPEINGVAHTISHLVQGLGQHGGYHIDLWRPRQYAAEQARHEPGFQEHLVGSISIPFYPQVQLGMPCYHTLYQCWQHSRPDLVQIVTEGPLGYAALRAARKLGIPVISDFHTHFDQYSHHYRLGWLFRLVSRYLRHLHNLTLLTLVPTLELQQYLTARGYHRLGLLERGVDTGLFNPGRYSTSLRARLGLAPGQLLVLLVSRLAQEKNLDLAFAAFRAIRQHVPDARFLLVGDGPERQRLQASYPDYWFAGMQTGVALAEHYASSDIFLYPSTTETFGNVIPEAMASGLPVVAFDYAAARLLIRSGENGMAVPRNDNAGFINASVYLARNAVLRRLQGQAACHTASTLGWEQVVKRLHTTLQGILQEVNHEAAART